MSKEEDLQDVRAEEEQRGRRPIGRLTTRQRRRLLASFEKALKEGDRQVFEEAIRRDLGLKPGSPEYAHALKVWRDFHRKPEK